MVAEKRKGIEEARKSLRNWFIGCALTGAVFIFYVVSGARGLDVNRWEVILAGVGPMFIYYIYGFSNSDEHRDMRGFSDSFYYLGFTFTLISLLSATWFEKFDQDEINVSLSFFGTALSTTIIGIVVRVVNTQFLYEEEDDFLTAQERNRILQKVENFVANMDGVNHQIERMSNAIENDLIGNIDSLSQTVEDTKDPFNKLKEGMHQQLRGITTPFIQAIDNISAELEGAPNSINEAVTDLSLEIENSSQPIKNAVGELSADIANISQPIKDAIDELSSEIQNLSQPIKDSIADINEQLNSEDIKIDLTRINQINRTLSSLDTRMKNIADEMEKTTKEMVKISEDAAEKIKKAKEDEDNNNNQGGGFFGGFGFGGQNRDNQ